MHVERNGEYSNHLIFYRVNFSNLSLPISTMQNSILWFMASPPCCTPLSSSPVLRKQAPTRERWFTDHSPAGKIIEGPLGSCKLAQFRVAL